MACLKSNEFVLKDLKLDIGISSYFKFSSISGLSWQKNKQISSWCANLLLVLSDLYKLCKFSKFTQNGPGRKRNCHFE